MDENCLAVTSSTPAQICGRAIYRADTTPISLMLSSLESIPTTLVNFDLDNSHIKKFFTWRASERSPLIVFDPEKKGIIQSATQLFGQWTFGGQGNNLPWQNGFQALRKLDANSDSALLGAELSALSLWFDRNQDGISDTGEVLDLTSYGILKISLDREVKTLEQGNLLMSEAAMSNSVGQGRSLDLIDWTSMSSESSSELVASLKNIGSTNQVESSRANSSQTKSVAQLNVGDDAAMQYEGVWKWKLDTIGDGAFGTTGVFGFTRSGNSLVGTNIIIRPVISQSNAPYREIILDRLKEVTVASNTLRFHSKDDDENQVLNSATLSADGKKLIGTSRVQLKNKQVIEYPWEAVR